MHDHTIFEPERLVLVRFSGPTDQAALRAAIEALARDPHYSPSYDGICDLRAAALSVTPEEAKAAATRVASDRTILGKWALLIDDPRGTALATLYVGALAGQHPLKVFSSIEGVAEYLKRDLRAILPT